MAGGPHAHQVMCPTCGFDDGVVTRADRVREGVESDDYVCDLGHRFGVSYRRGPVDEPQWPPGKDDLDAVAAVAATKR